MVAAVAGLRCRQIDEDDIDAVASLLAHGFRSHDRAFWLDAFAQLSRHQPPHGLPKYGYLLETADGVVGAILLICSTVPSSGAATTRCNLSSWYVDPAYRAYAPMLVSQALRHKGVTYLNVSSAPHTRPIIEAQGFSRYTDGVFVALPLLQGLFGPRVAVLPAQAGPPAGADPCDGEVMAQHVAHGCIGLWCVSDSGALPFVFRPRMIRGVLPSALLIYCRDIADFVRYAGPLGRALTRRGCPFVVLDANGRVPGLFGLFSPGVMPKYFKGPHRPRLGDLAYTERAVLGV